MQETARPIRSDSQSRSAKSPTLQSGNACAASQSDQGWKSKLIAARNKIQERQLKYDKLAGEMEE